MKFLGVWWVKTHLTSLQRKMGFNPSFWEEE